jgi:succinate dehydrogenase/fumarate reductase flavoprotein subunit
MIKRPNIMAEGTIESDVLIVGGGGAGLRAAISSRQQGAETLLINKGTYGRSGATVMAGADLTADGRSMRQIGFFGEPRDSPETFFEDIVHQGYYLNNQKLVEIYVRDAGDRIRELLDWGLPVQKSDERAIITSGSDISRALVRWGKILGVKVASNTMLLELLTTDGKIVGALGLDLLNGDLIHFRAKAIVLCTGGWHKAFSPNAGPRDLTGDGVAAAFRAGAALANLEFITFCCNILLWPPIWRGSIFAVVIDMLTGGRLTNEKGETFLEGYDPYIVGVGTSTEWNKSFVSLASQREVLEGRGSPHGGIFFDNGDVHPEVFEARVNAFYPKWRYYGADFAPMAAQLRQGEPLEVGPAVEYFEGGILVDNDYATNIEGLYAAGECAASLFGANRVAAATTEMLVTGAIAGSQAAKFALGTKLAQTNRAYLDRLRKESLLPLACNSGIRPAEVRREVQSMAHSNLGPIRTKEQLEALLDFLEDIRRDMLPILSTTAKSRYYNKEWIEALELTSLVDLLGLCARSALLRTESRGVHYRADFPSTDNTHWLKEIIVQRQGDHMQYGYRPIETTSLVPSRGIKPYMDMMKEMMQARSAIGGAH